MAFLSNCVLLLLVCCLMLTLSKLQVNAMTKAQWAALTEDQRQSITTEALWKEYSNLFQDEKGGPITKPSEHSHQIEHYQTGPLPTVAPSEIPTSYPTMAFTAGPSSVPTSIPTADPTVKPSPKPTSIPSSNPTSKPSAKPTSKPTSKPTVIPSAAPTPKPTSHPTAKPTSKPTSSPTSIPSAEPTSRPTSTMPSSVPTAAPSAKPTSKPSSAPSSAPTSKPSPKPTSIPTSHPTSKPTAIPTSKPTAIPTVVPTAHPTVKPTSRPSSAPSSVPTAKPTALPTVVPSAKPSGEPTGKPTGQPTSKPSSRPSGKPTTKPTSHPSSHPSRRPSGQPSRHPSAHPSSQPSRHPSSQPTAIPSSQPTHSPTAPTVKPSSSAPTTTIAPTVAPTLSPLEIKFQLSLFITNLTNGHISPADLLVIEQAIIARTGLSLSDFHLLNITNTTLGGGASPSVHHSQATLLRGSKVETQEEPAVRAEIVTIDWMIRILLSAYPTEDQNNPFHLITYLNESVFLNATAIHQMQYYVRSNIQDSLENNPDLKTCIINGFAMSKLTILDTSKAPNNDATSNSNGQVPLQSILIASLVPVAGCLLIGGFCYLCGSPAWEMVKESLDDKKKQQQQQQHQGKFKEDKQSNYRSSQPFSFDHIYLRGEKETGRGGEDYDPSIAGSSALHYGAAAGSGSTSFFDFNNPATNSVRLSPIAPPNDNYRRPPSPSRRFHSEFSASDATSSPKRPQHGMYRYEESVRSAESSTDYRPAAANASSTSYWNALLHRFASGFHFPSHPEHASNYYSRQASTNAATPAVPPAPVAGLRINTEDPEMFTYESGPSFSPSYTSESITQLQVSPPSPSRVTGGRGSKPGSPSRAGGLFKVASRPRIIDLGIMIREGSNASAEDASGFVEGNNPSPYYQQQRADSFTSSV